MARRNSQNAISLFPFLAVLVCTMGALILLLLVTTRRMRNEQFPAATTNESNMPDAITGDWIDAGEFGDVSTWAAADIPTHNGDGTGKPVVLPESDADPTTATDHQFSISLMPPASPDNDLPEDNATLAASRQVKLEEVQRQLAEESERHDVLLQQIAATKARLQDSTSGSDDYQARHSELNLMRQQEAELNERLELKREYLVQLRAELEVNSKTAEAGELLLRDRESALVALREIVQQKTETTRAGTDETVIEFTNATGTQRSPVIINVTNSGFEFLPSNVKVASAEMQGFPANDNPLLAGILAIHSSRNAKSLSTMPYVLLLIRPGGSRFFYAAQRTLTNAGIHFGYELLEESRGIAAGQCSIEETRVVRNAIIASLARRRDLYGGLMAKVEALRVGTRVQPQRRVRVLPDGRVAVAEESGGEGEGRFYAGGEAPPRNPDGPGAWLSHDSESGTASENNRTPPERRSTAAASTDGRPEAKPQSPYNDDAIFPPLVANADNTAQQSTAQPEIIPGVSRGPDEQTIATRDPVDSRPGPAGNSDLTEPSELTAGQVFPHSGSLSANMGVSGRGDSWQAGQNPSSEQFGAPAASPTGVAAAESGASTADLFAPTWPPNTPSSKRRAGQPETGDPNRAGPEPSGWSDLSTAHSEPTTRTAGTAPDSVFGPSASSAGGAAGAHSGGAGGVVSSSDSQAFLDRFMREVEARSSPSKPDPYLLALLNRARRRNGNRETEKQGQTIHRQQNTAPSDSVKRNDSRKEAVSSPTVRAPRRPNAGRDDGGRAIRIVLEKTRLTIGGFEAIDTTGWDAQQILATVLRGLNAEFNSQNRTGINNNVPVIEFVVAPGMEPLQQLLTKELASVELQTRTLRRIQSVPGTKRPGSPTVNSPSDRIERQEPAEPVELPRPPRSGQGLSI